MRHKGIDILTHTELAEIERRGDTYLAHPDRRRRVHRG
jgi:hypothetical protein